ncbi:hypothetical protein LJC18_05925 [Lachnospiraceae bacterium OttesenSCG-928-E19]|nr:hypothetical protein [Lachnospiraceae bacterium OttesenSCG-928-E19]
MNMLDIARMGKQELEDELRRIETEKDEMDRKMKEFQSFCEEMEEKNMHTWWHFESMREAFDSTDHKIFSLINDGEEKLNILRRNEEDIAQSLQDLKRKKHKEWDMREEDISYRMYRMQEQEVEKI